MFTELSRFRAVCVVGAVWGCLGSAAAAATIETVFVGHPGNAADSTGFGAVNYSYRMGKYEVTAGQYTEFLNAVAGVDTFSLYNTQMGRTDFISSGITRSGAGTLISPYSYSVDPDFVNRPVNFISFWDAARFANWLHNGQPTGPQDATTTEDGAYTLTPDAVANNTVTRNPGAIWAIPTNDEWYKAAYYDSSTGDYFDYPTSSDGLPGRDLDDVSGNNANYGTPIPIDSPFYTTVVGEFQNSASPYGTFDQGGNVAEWTETFAGLPSERRVRGGAWGGSAAVMLAVSNNVGAVADHTGTTGFRVMTVVPEPGSSALLIVGAAAMLPVLVRRAAQRRMHSR